MDLLKAPSTQSLVDSDVGSIDSFPILDIEELNDEEYGIPAVSELPSLESVLADESGLNGWEADLLGGEGGGTAAPSPAPSPTPPRQGGTPSQGGSLLKYVFLQGISQQITTAADRIGAGMGSAVAAWGDLVAIGTSHGLVMAFSAQALRWCCQKFKDQAAVTSMDYNEDATRLLAGFARGVVVMYESSTGSVMRRVEACGGGPWGVLRVVWGPPSTAGGSCAVAADTGGSVWMLRFTRVLGVRGSKVSCLFSGARGEVCAIEPLSSGLKGGELVLGMATLWRVVVVWGLSGLAGGGGAGGRCCQASLTGPPTCLPLLAWQPTTTSRKDPVLCSARGTTVQFHQVRWGAAGPEALLLKRVELPFQLSLLRWLGARRLTLLDVGETLHLWDVSTGIALETLDLSNAQLIYANAHFKGVATGGNVSEALSLAGGGAVGGAAAGGGSLGALMLLGRAGLHRVAVRAAHAAAHHHADLGQWEKALQTIVSEHKSLEGRKTRQAVSRQRAESLLQRLENDPAQLSDPVIALATVDACIQMNLLDTLWGPLWDAVSALGRPQALGEAAGKRASEGQLPRAPPAVCQYLVSQMAETDPQKLQKALLHLPVDCLDLHQVLSECKRLGLWQAWVRVTSTALRDPPLPLCELLPLVGHLCRQNGRPRVPHSCPGDALLVYVADCLAGRDYPRGLLPAQDRPTIRHEILGCLLYEGEDVSPLPHLRALLLHDTGSTLRMLGMAYTEPPFMGPMGKLNRLKMSLALHNVLQTALEPDTFTEEEIAEIVFFTANLVANGTLPADVHLIGNIKRHFSQTSTSPEANKLIERAWLSLLMCTNNVANHLPINEMMDMALNTKRLKVERYLMEKAGNYDGLLETFLNDVGSENEMFSYLEKYATCEERLIGKQMVDAGERLAGQWPEQTARILVGQIPDIIPVILATLEQEDAALAFTDVLQRLGALNAEISLKHLELLCKLRADDVLEFLNDAPSALLPDAALEVVRKYYIKAAEPKCLETCGDLTGAVKASVALMLAADSREERERLAGETCSLCMRASKVSGTQEAELLWRQLIDGVSKLPEPPEAPLPALLLEGAANYLPLPWLVSQLCGGGGHAGALRGALSGLLEAAKSSAEAVSAAARLTGSELHAALAKALRGHRIMSVSSALCGTCHNPLNSRPLIRAYCCGHAFHLECDPVAGRCGRCGQVAEEVRLTRGTQMARSEPPQQFSLCVVAPPRPDLEGAI